MSSLAGGPTEEAATIPSNTDLYTSCLLPAILLMLPSNTDNPMKLSSRDLVHNPLPLLSMVESDYRSDAEKNVIKFDVIIMQNLGCGN